jgi:hypothetical protein
MDAGKTWLKTRSPEVLESRSGGGCLVLFGLPFFLAGLFLLQIPIGLIPMTMEDGSATPWWMDSICSVMGLVFVVVSLGLMLGRKGVVIDRRRQTVVHWRGLWPYFKQTEYQFTELTGVSLSYDGSGDGPATYPVRLTGRDRLHAISILDPADYHEARRSAERLARFLELPLADVTTGKNVTRAPGELDESLRARALRLGERRGREPERPPSMRTVIRQTPEGLALEIPPPPFTYLRLIPVTLAVLFACLVGWVFVRPLLLLPMPNGIRIAFLGFIGIFFIFAPITSALRYFLLGSRRSQRVTVSPEWIRLEDRVGSKVLTSEISGDDLEELTLPTLASRLENMGPAGRPAPEATTLSRWLKSPGIFARSDDQTLQFGQGLPEPELEYLHQLIGNRLLDEPSRR